MPLDRSLFRHSIRLTVRNYEIDYRSPARFGEELEVMTRISYIRNTSFAFEGIIEEVAGRRRVSENVSVHVWLDGETGAPQRVGEVFRRLVAEFEGNNVRMEESG